MRKERMSENEYNAIKSEIENIKKQLEELRFKKQKLQERVSWYERTKEKLNKTYEKGFCYNYFGKRAKNLNKEEYREYQRLLTKKSRDNGIK